ncbi:MAG: M1 family metallopeptidase [Candidatus Nitronauta litoralis]|uniref:Aminopeptidase N n=1 Tax=Candidatus Nitronauta litoralis TaxID=2705533 RepID=A0A7T0BTP2_9BACT|nr:MAG: M1 family metallopeptidase [Candidatus Nitronauta litoralis]
MTGTKICKFHYLEGHSEHWGLLDRQAFAGADAKPHYAPDVPLRPVHLKLDLSFDWEQERVWGTTTHKIEVQDPETRELRLDAMQLEVERVRVRGRKVEFENTDQHLLIPLPASVKKGDRLDIEIQHSVTRPVAGIYFTKADPFYPDRFKTVWSQGQDEDSKYYFPCFDQPNFKQTTEVMLHLPPGMFGLSNGRLLKKKKTAKESFFHYKMEKPYSTYLLSIVAGEFSEFKKKQDGVDIIWYVQPGREKEGRNAFKDTGRMVKFFSNYTGYRYPYPHYTQIAVPEFIFGGMENFTVTTQTDLTLHDDRAALDIDSDGLVAHEAAHTWFGNVLTARSWAHAWLHESFATYFDALYTRESKGEEEFRYQLLEDAETYFAEDNKYRRPIVTHIYKEPIDLFDAHLYPGGAVRLHHLKTRVTEPKFREALSLYLKRHEFGLVETVDLFRCLEEATHRNYDDWRGQWIHRGGYPVLEIKFAWDSATSMATVDVRQTQRSDKKNESLLFNLDLEVAFYTQRGEERIPISITRKEEKFLFKLKRKPLYFRLDPDYTVPCKKVKLDCPRPMVREQLKRDEDPIGRIQAAETLTRSPSNEDVSLLSDRLRRESFWGVGCRIAAALAKIGGDAARDGLLRGLKSTSPKIRHGIVRALGNFRDDPKVVKALKKATEDPSYRVEAEAYRSLGKMKDPTLREFIEEGLSRPSHNDMAQSAALSALGALEDPDCWQMLVAHADYGAAKMSRAAAMMAMAKLAKTHSQLKSEALDCFRRFAREKRGTPAAVFRGKLWAIQALQMMDDLSALPILREVESNEADGRLCRRAGDAVQALLASAKKPAELKELREELDGVLKENKSFRDRLEVLEKKQPKRKGKS